MTVFDNIAYALRNRRTPKSEIHDRVAHALELVGLSANARSYPGHLSGGQQQRVALARAIVTDDGLILFDEPLSNVDAKVRERLRTELFEMQRSLRFSAVYVTHDQAEASALADRIAVMNSAVIAQLGAPREVYSRPASRYVASFVGSANQLAGQVEAVREGACTVRTELGILHAHVEPETGFLPRSEQDVTLVFRPEHVRISATPDTQPNRWEGVIRHVIFLGSGVEYSVASPAGDLVVRSADPENLAGGDPAWLSIDPSRVWILEGLPEPQ
jgi:iron(III) transport system ATP-binding protein